jgi:hypothetical protein
LVALMSGTVARLCRKKTGRARLLCPGISGINLLGDGESVVDLDAEVAHRALDLGVPQQELDGPQIAGTGDI